MTKGAIISFKTGLMYSANGCFPSLSALSEGNALPTNWTSSMSTTSLHYSESPFQSERPYEYFSPVTKKKIRMKCHSRCIVCMKVLVGLGQCTHILDAAEEGAKMVSHCSQQRRHLRSHPYVGNICHQHWSSQTNLQLISCHKRHSL
jgi:hypothetical protein